MTYSTRKELFLTSFQRLNSAGLKAFARGSVHVKITGTKKGDANVFK